MSKGGKEDQFHAGTTRTSPTEETGRLDQPHRCQEGPLINRQGIQAEEPGDGLGSPASQPGKWRRGWAEPGGVWSATRFRTESVADGAERGSLSASTGAAGADSEGGEAGRVADAGHPDDLRSGMPASAAQSVGTDLRAGIR